MKNLKEKSLMADEEIKKLQNKKSHQPTETGRKKKER